MMRAAALLCLTLMSVLILSWGLPQLYDMALLKSLDKTHAFFSPVLKKFIYTEQVHGEDEKAAQKSDGHHADIVYKDEDGGYHDRLEFEAALPFIYFRNMEARGCSPSALKAGSCNVRISSAHDGSWNCPHASSTARGLHGNICPCWKPILDRWRWSTRTTASA